jgi:hypothetical protein
MIVRVAILPPKMPADINQRAMHNFGIVQKITDKNWSNACLYEVGKGKTATFRDDNYYFNTRKFCT